ncbi:MAG: hypothetical protein K2M78_09740 [Lachnospiraceae bacterium]|nr:hypothetical protein [Lachnospiraceae bacterium]
MAEINEVAKRLSKIFEEVMEKPVPKELFENNVNLIERYHIDSLVALKIIVKIEQEFSVLIEDDEEAIQMLKSPQKTLNYLTSNQ